MRELPLAATVPMNHAYSDDYVLRDTAVRVVALHSSCRCSAATNRSSKRDISASVASTPSPESYVERKR
jgi:hypothetical protein